MFSGENMRLLVTEFEDEIINEVNAFISF